MRQEHRDGRRCGHAGKARVARCVRVIPDGILLAEGLRELGELAAVDREGDARELLADDGLLDHAATVRAARALFLVRASSAAARLWSRAQFTATRRA